ncbi:protease [Rhodopirellula sp. SM50]|nr:protease [Rhodopirellula sp. SM50]
MLETDFPHIQLVKRTRGSYQTPDHHQRDYTPEREKELRANHKTHAVALARSVDEMRAIWAKGEEERPETAPALPAGKPILLQLDPDNLDLDEIRRRLDFEIVCQEEDGFVIVASHDVDVTTFNEVVDLFSRLERGGGVAARIYDVSASSGDERLRQILSSELYDRWGEIDDDEPIWINAGIACNGGYEPRLTPMGKKETEETYQARHRSERMKAYDRWDEVRTERIGQIERFVEAYDGYIDPSTKEPDTDIPDEFTARIRLPGVGLRDFVFNYPYLFDVEEAEVAELPVSPSSTSTGSTSPVVISPPPSDAVAICVVDSGIQENHRLLKAAVDSSESRCFFGNSSADVADYVTPSGHGTRIAGVVLFGDNIPSTGTHQAEFWIQNARVLNKQNELPDDRAIYDMLSEIVDHFRYGHRGTRIYNQSICSPSVCRLRHMSAWAAKIDALSHRHDVLFIQSVGNIHPDATGRMRLGIKQHLAAGRDYPSYLLMDSCRVANPGQSLQALTVGSISRDVYRSSTWNSFADAPQRPSAFSRTGRGIFGVVKPDVVEFGGDFVRNLSNDISNNPIAKSVYPDLVRCNLHTAGPSTDRDQVGTSFAAPKVTRLAAQLQAAFPKESTLLYRALIALSARWPDWAFFGSRQEQIEAVRHLGYGLPDHDRATQNTDFRVTMITPELQKIKAKQVDVYQVNIPDRLRKPGNAGEVMIEVCLSYSAASRRTRRDRRGYLSVWLDWRTNYAGESADEFAARLVKEASGSVSTDRERFDWVVGEHAGTGKLTASNRTAGTLQKDWCKMPADQLPASFCIAVVGHQGHSVSPLDEAKYHLTVAVESLGQEIELYNDMEAEVDLLASEIEASKVEIDELET